MLYGNDSDVAEILEEELRRLTECLKDLGAEKIILFGSYARGRRDALTDLDLLVVMESDEPFVRRAAGVYGKLMPRVAADILVYTPGEWQEVKERPFIKKALEEGRVLYEKRAG